MSNPGNFVHHLLNGILQVDGWMGKPHGIWDDKVIRNVVDHTMLHNYLPTKNYFTTPMEFGFSKILPRWAIAFTARSCANTTPLTPSPTISSKPPHLGRLIPASQGGV